MAWFDLEDKVVLVTGGSRGIGLEMVESLLAQKAKVVLCARKQLGLEAVVKKLNNDDNLLTVPAHTAKEKDVEALFNAIKEKYGRLDVLINNVGMNLLTGSVIDTELSKWQKILDSNLNSTFLCSKKAAAMMREQKKGKIVNISSTAGSRVAPGMGIYGVAKAAIEMLTKVLAFELAHDNIQVNAVAPCMVRTDFSKPFWSVQDIHEQIVKTIPLGRIAEPVEVVQAVLFLASDVSNFITGQIIHVDGGTTVC